MTDQLLTEREMNLQVALGSQDPFVKFVEQNDHEGEQWVFWLQREGNEAALNKLSHLIAEVVDKAQGSEGPYQLYQQVEIPERDVDVLVEHAGGGYMANHNKVTGRLTVPDDLVEVDEYGPNLDRLYKGGITDLFK